ncbi:MAG: DnaB-like helicase N-terminal domain-containing protein [Oscillospiraceae bacterium]
MANDKFELSLEAMGINLPYSIEAEQAVLGAVIVDYKVIDEITGLLLPEYFYSKQNAAIFREMMLMYGTGKPVDFVTVLDSVSAAGVFSSEEYTKVYL